MGAFDTKHERINWTREVELKIKKANYPDNKEIQEWCDDELALIRRKKK